MTRAEEVPPSQHPLSRRTPARTAPRLAGEVLMPGQDGYADAATVMFAAGTPDLVVRPDGPAGVADALGYAAETGLTVSVRSGGHSMSGLSTHTDGMVIDLRPISGVRILDRASGLVRVGAGATWGAVADALRPAGLAISSGDTRGVGVGGLALGGGIGWLVRRYGLAIDSLAGADLVTAAGQAIRADAASHPGLFWALRGGGGNFGVVTSFDFIAQPVTEVTYGKLAFQVDLAPGGLPRFLAGWRDRMAAGDDNLTTTVSVMPPMGGRPPLVELACCYASADERAGTAALRPFRALAPVAADDVRVRPYAEVLEEAQPMPPGLRVEMRDALFAQLDADSIERIAVLVRGGAAVAVRSLGGAAARVPAGATAFAHRDATALVMAGIMLPASAPPEAAAGHLDRWAAVANRGIGGYVNFLGSATPADVAACYPPATYERLAEVKRRYDPANVFRRNHNIRPA